jgi:hypothetical protein
MRLLRRVLVLPVSLLWQLPMQLLVPSVLMLMLVLVVHRHGMVLRMGISGVVHHGQHLPGVLHGALMSSVCTVT